MHFGGSVAVGGGANLALMNYHDLIVCSTKARFKYPFAELSLTPELGSSYVFPLIVGPARAKEVRRSLFLASASARNEIAFVAAGDVSWRVV